MRRVAAGRPDAAVRQVAIFKGMTMVQWPSRNADVSIWNDSTEPIGPSSREGLTGHCFGSGEPLLTRTN